MNPGKAQTVVLTTGMVVFFLGWFDSAKRGQKLPSSKFVVGTSVTFLILEVFADIDPPLGTALAVAIGTSACFHYGAALKGIANVGDLPSTDQPKKPVKATPVHVTTKG